MRQKGFIFVLMPFNKSFDDIYNYGIKQTANNCGFYCERVDEQVYEGTILTRIYNQIEKADLIIADMSGMNPNVFYETGYAHALNKNVILLTQNSNDIPFDLKHYPHIIYNNNIKQLSELLTLKLNWFKENKDEKRIDKSGFVELYNKGKLISENSTILFSCIETYHPFIADMTEEEIKDVKESSNIVFTLNLFNTGNQFVDTISDIGLVFENIYTDSRFNENNSGVLVQLPDNKILITFGQIEFLYPQSWKTFKLDLGTRKQFKKYIDSAELRIFKEDGVSSIPVKIEYENVSID